jgi:hypothetical protein
MAVTGFSFLLLRIAIGTRLRRSGALEAEDRAAEIKHWMSLAMYGIAAPLAFYRPHWALAIIALITLVWIYPVTHVHHQPEHPSQSGNHP